MKQRRWLKAYMETGNATQAARQAYDIKDESSAWNIGFENVRKLKQPIEGLMERMGLSDIKLMTKLDEGLDATRSSNAAILVTKDGSVMKAEEQGLIEVQDYATRHKYLETALKLKKHLGTESTNQINIGQLNVSWQEGERL